MAETSARRVALAALRAWRAKREFADAIITNLLAKSDLRVSDRGFGLDLFYGVLRNLSLLDFWIAQLRSRRVDVDLRDILRLGLYQLFLAHTPEHAAVFETVALGPKRQRPIVNALLRSASRNRKELLEKANAQPLEIRTSHPRFLIERWLKAFGNEATEKLCDWNNAPPPTYARINYLKIDRESFLKRYRAAKTLSRCANFVELSLAGNALEAGDCYVQDPSTALACELLQPHPGERVLDACAAPGGKTSYLAALMQNNGILVACDRDPDRIRLLAGNLNRLGVRIAKLVHHDWSKPGIPNEIESEAPFDRILVDAPCSNSGVMRRRVDVRWRLRERDFLRMQRRQLDIVRAVLPLLKSGGILVYSTCSLEREENEDVVQALLEKISILELEEEQRSLPFTENFDGAFVASFLKKA